MGTRHAAATLLAWCLPAFASGAALGTDAAKGRYALDTWSTDDGLPQTSVNAILQSRDGYLWLATAGGVARFDGTTFTTIGSGEHGLPSDRALALAEDLEGRIWIGTEGGLARYDRGAITTLSDFKGSPLEQVFGLAAHPDGSVWFTTRSGALGRVHSDRVQVVVPPRGVLGATPSHVRADAGGAIWVQSGTGVWRLEPGATTPVQVRPRLDGRGPQGALALGSDGVWFVSETGLRHSTAGKTRDFKILAPDFKRAEVRAMASGPDGVLWMAMTTGDIWRFEPETEALKWVLSAGIGGTQDLLVDREGSVWVGNRVSGLARVRLRLFQSLTTADGLSQDNSRGIFKDSKDRVWVGGDCGGVAMREREGAPFRKLTTEGIPGCVFTIAEDAQGDIWLGGRGVARWRNGRVENFSVRAGWPTASVRSIFPDRDGLLWIGGNHGLASWDGQSLQQHPGQGSIVPKNVKVIYQSRDGALWLATSVGLLRYQGGTFHSYTRGHGLKDNDVRAIYEDKAGTFWIGTYGGGLAWLSGGRIRAFSAAEGLRDTFLSSIAEDAAANLWLSGDRGVTRVGRPELERLAKGERSRVHAIEYGLADGMLSAETNGGFQGAVARIDGRLWYPTLLGVVMIDPMTAPDPVPPAISIDRVTVNGQPQEPSDGLSVGPGAVDVEFAYSGLSLKTPHAVTFRYQLEPWDADWIEAGTRRTANYSRLSPGEYKFTVRAANRDGIWSAATAPLNMRVLPLYWQTWWFRALALLAVAALPLLRGQHLRQRRAELEALVAERTNELGDAVARLSVSEQQALRAKDEALAASRAKSIFLANMSHELRTPLNAVIGFAQVLSRRDSFRGEDREGLHIIQRSGEHLLGLINDVLSLSKIEAGALTLHERPFDLKALIESVRAMTSARAETKGLEVAFEIEPGLPQVVLGDEGRLRQILINLLGNAVKFTVSGKVTLRVGYRDERVSFAVADTGPGIAEAEIPKLFGTFVQTESGENSREGTGLGLAISAQIVKLMGGDIAVQSLVGQGSVFSFEVPMKAAGEAAPQKPTRRIVGLSPGQSPVLILVVDDTEENRLLLKQVLSASGFLVDEASDGEQAIERFEARRPALILMDARMKVVDGREATRRIRERESQSGGPRTVIIALTAGAFEHEREQMLAAGADDFVAKPFVIETILEKIGSSLALSYTFGETSKPETPVEGQQGGPLSPKRLTALSEALRLDLYEALSEGHVQRARAAAERIRAADDDLGTALLAEIRAFRLDELLGLMQEAADGPPTPATE